MPQYQFAKQLRYRWTSRVLCFNLLCCHIYCFLVHTFGLSNCLLTAVAAIYAIYSSTVALLVIASVIWPVFLDFFFIS